MNPKYLVEVLVEAADEYDARDVIQDGDTSRMSIQSVKELVQSD